MSIIPDSLIAEILSKNKKVTGPKRGDAIFEGVDYPRTWFDFIGQTEAIEQCQVAIASAKARGRRLDHMLVESGIAGVGKTSLAYLVAAAMDVGVIATSGPLTMEKARDMILTMDDQDILFVDEAHTLTAGNKNRADWFLPFLTDGKFYTDRGAQAMPDVTVIAATTDGGKLPPTLRRRFLVKPMMVRYTPAEAAMICGQLGRRMSVDVPGEALADVARAANGNPGKMREILTAVRDLGHAYPETHPNLEKAFRWSQVSEDGLSVIARDMLLLLLRATDHTSSIDSLRSLLGEPGPIHQHEQELMQRGLVTITGRGRKLTDTGIVRAHEEAVARS